MYLHDVLVMATDRDPNGVAVVADDEAFTYRQLLTRVEGLAPRFQAWLRAVIGWGSFRRMLSSTSTRSTPSRRPA